MPAIVNGARARSSRSLYDALLFHRENVEMIQETTGKLDVTAHQLQDLWHQVRVQRIRGFCPIQVLDLHTEAYLPLHADRLTS